VVNPGPGRRGDRAKLFEELHRRGELFDYSRRAAEILRHRFVSRAVRRFNPRPARLLDVGCSMGQLTVQLAGLPEALFAVDLSRTAIRAARERLRTAGARARFVVASATALPFREGTFDVAVLSDGLHSWQLTPEERRLALSQAHRVARPGGYALITEYLHPRDFPGFVEQVRASPLDLVSIEYLYDRLWYQFESWFKAVRHRRWVWRLLGSVPLAVFLHSIARPLGPRASRHICVVARRASSDRR
jgi:ubiquinone/menaquinone biosynthesis C-methylase UbiE